MLRNAAHFTVVHLSIGWNGLVCSYFICMHLSLIALYTKIESMLLTEIFQFNPMNQAFSLICVSLRGIILSAYYVLSLSWLVCVVALFVLQQYVIIIWYNWYNSKRLRCNELKKKIYIYIYIHVCIIYVFLYSIMYRYSNSEKTPCLWIYSWFMVICLLFII